MNDLIQTVAKFAPVVGTALGGPFGGAIGALIATAFNGDTKEQQDLINKINSDPDAKFKLLALESQIKLESQKLQNEMAQAVLTDDREREAIAEKDRENARKREADLASAGNKDYMPKLLGIGMMIIYAIIQFYSIFKPEINPNISIRIQDLFMTVMWYYFGSSHGSKKKDHIIQNLK